MFARLKTSVASRSFVTPAKAGIQACLISALALSSCGKSTPPKPAPAKSTESAPSTASAKPADAAPAPAPAPDPNILRTLRFGLIAKSQSNPVFQAARKGAMDAAAELGPNYKAKVEILWETPAQEDAQQQADKVEQLANQGVDGIAISCSEAGKVKRAISDAVKNRGVKVMCFDSDCPDSGRFAFHGVDDLECGKRVMSELAKLLDGKGKIAILAGNQTAPNLQRRVQGVKEIAAQFPGLTIVDTFYHKETPQDAAAKVEQVMQANPDLAGWAFVGGWPLFTSNALKWQPGTVKCVSVDALLPQLAYLESGHVQVLLAQQVYKWGHRSVELLLDAIMKKQTPKDERDLSDLIPVTQENMKAYAENWKTWLPQ